MKMIRKSGIICATTLLLMGPVVQGVEPASDTEWKVSEEASQHITEMTEESSQTAVIDGSDSGSQSTEDTPTPSEEEADKAPSAATLKAGEKELRQVLQTKLGAVTLDEDLSIGELLYTVMFTNSPEAAAIWQGLGMDWSATPTEGNYITEYNDSLAWFRNAPKETWTLANGNVAYFINNNSKNTVIISHGYRGSSNNMGPWAKLYQDMGFNILVPDATGHGASQPSADINFGWHEKEIYKQWIDQVLAKTKTEGIMLQGMSMGSATVLMTSGETLPPAVKGVVADSAYTSVLAEVNYLKELILSLVTENQGLISLLLDAAIEEADGILQEKQGFSMAEASSLNQVAKSTIPTLFIHSIDDHFIPVNFVDELYQGKTSATRLAQDRLWKAGGGDHIGGILYDLPGYKQQVNDFVATVISEPTTPTDPSEGQETTDSSEGQETTDPSEGQETTDSSEGQETTESSEGQETTESSEPQETTDSSEVQGTTDSSESQETTESSESQRTTDSSEGQGTTTSVGKETDKDKISQLLPQTGEAKTVSALVSGLVIVLGVVFVIRKRR